MSEYKEESAKKKKMFSLYDVHLEFMATLENASHYVRWLIDQDEGFQKFQRSKKDES